MFSSKSLWLITSITLMTGCTHLGPTYEQPEVAVPASWPTLSTKKGDDTHAVLASWRQDDPILAQLTEQLYANNHDIQIAALNYSRSRVQRAVAAADNDPEVGFSAGARRQRLSEDGSLTRIIGISAKGEQREQLINALASPFNLFTAGFDASWEPDLWGRVANRITAADAAKQLASYELDNLQLVLETELMRCYTQLRAQQLSLSLLHSLAANVASQQSIAESHYQGGMGSRQSVLPLDSEVRRIHKQIFGAKDRIRQLMNQITLLLGASPGSLDDLLASTEKSNLPIFSSLPVAMPSAVLSQRPDIKQAEARLRSATAAIGLAEADLYPRFQLTGDISLEALSSDTLTNWSSRTWHIGPALYLPVFNRGQLRRQVELTQLDQQQAAIQYQQAVLTAWTEVDSAIHSVNQSSQQLTESKRMAEIMSQEVALTEAEYQNGLSNQLPVLRSQRQWLSDQLALVQDSLNYNLSQLRLYKSVGGGSLAQDAMEN